MHLAATRVGLLRFNDPSCVLLNRFMPGRGWGVFAVPLGVTLKQGLGTDCPGGRLADGGDGALGGVEEPGSFSGIDDPDEHGVGDA